MAVTSLDVITKHPEDSIDVSMDFSNWLATSDTLSAPASEVIGDDSVLTVSNLAVSGQTVTMRLGAGTNGSVYQVEITVTVSDGQTLVGIGKVKVRDR